MTSIATENLEERIERIRKRTEEIEKKHRAAEEDRLMALMDNAMVKTKPPNDDDWPKAHKYDKLDFTYDIKPEKLDENIVEQQQQQQQLIKPKRDYKKFADGEGPPPDPIYNFLADAERDGKEQQQQKNDKKIDLKSNHINGNNNKNNDINNKNKEQFNKRGGNNSGQQNNNNNNNMFRNRNNSGGNNANNIINNNNGKTSQNYRYQKQNSQTDNNQKQNLQPEQWRSEKIDDNNKINNRQKSNNNIGINCEKWRRNDWDNNDIKTDKNSLNDIHKSPKHNNSNVNKNYHHHNNQQQQNYHHHSNNNSNYTSAENIIEKRANIMVSVSPGEVKSVKLTSAQVIGSGRVGPRQLTKPQFQIQSMEKEQPEIITHLARQQINAINKLDNFNSQQNNNNNNNNNYQQFATKNSIPPTHRQQQTAVNQQTNINNGISSAPKSPIKDKKNLKSLKYVPPQQQKPVLPSLISINGGKNVNDNILASPTNPIVVNNNVVNSLLNVTGNSVATNSGAIATVDINVSEIDDKVLAVAKTLTNKPEFAKKSVQDRLLRIRQMSQTDVVSLTGGTVEKLSNNNDIVDELININNNDNLNATLSIKDANKDEQIDCIKNIETIVACN